jgi:hypothetical protein
MRYDLGFFDHETGRIECAENPFGAKVLPRSGIKRHYVPGTRPVKTLRGIFTNAFM